MTAQPDDRVPSDTRPVETAASTPSGVRSVGPAAPDPAVVALGRALRRTQERVEVLDRGVAALAADVAAFRDRPLTPPAGAAPDDAGDGGGDGPPPVRSWLLIDDPEQASTDLAELVAWVARIYLRYSQAYLSSCWLWHPEAVEELSCLRGAHTEAFHPDSGSWMRAGDWHDRQRPGVERRLNALLTKCSLSRHVARNGRPASVTEPPAPPLAAHHAAVAGWWAAHHNAGPTPSVELLGEAERAESPDVRGRP